MIKEFSDLLFLILVAGIFVIFLRWHLNPHTKFDVMDLVCTDGKLNDKKFMRMGAWMVSTWGFYWLTLHDKMTEYYFGGYMLAWAGVAALDKWQRKGEAQ